MVFREAALGTGVSTYPADFVTLCRIPPQSAGTDTEAYKYNIIFQGQAVTFDLAYSRASHPVGSWVLRSFPSGLIVKSGGAIPAGTGWTSPTDLACGVYRLYLTNSLGSPQGGGLLVVTRNVAGMPTTPPDLFVESVTLATMTMTGARRVNIPNASDTAGTAPQGHLEANYVNAHWKPVDSVARPKRTLLNFAETVTDASASSAVRAVVADFASTVDIFEGRNEPSGTPDSGYVPEAQQFYTDVKAAAPSALVASGAPVTIGPGAAAALSSFYGAGGGNYSDVIAFHTYNAHSGDLHAARTTWDSFVSVLTQYGQQNKTRICTEAASFFTAEFGAANYVRQAHLAMLDLLVQEQYGVTKENWYYFYARDNGFDDYPSQMSTLTGQPYPLVACLLTHSQELIGTQWEARLDFGTVDNDMVIGSSYRRADGTGVVSLLSPGKRDHPVTLQVTGGTPVNLTTVDCWGNQSTVTVTGGLARVAATTLPIYVRLPAGVTATAVDGTARWGTKRSAGAVGYVGAKNLPTVVFTDNADRADGPIGNGWQTFGSATIGIAGNVFAKSGGDWAASGAYRDLGHSDGKVTLTANSSYGGILFRYTDPNNWWALNDTRVYKCVGGVLTITPAGPMTGGQTVILNGPNIGVYGDQGVLLTELTDSFNQTATKHGLFIWQSLTTLDNFAFTTGSDGSLRSGSLDQVLNGPLINALPLNRGNDGDAVSVWNSAAPVVPGSPQTITVELPSAVPVDRLLVHCPPPLQANLSVILRADVQALGADGTTWTTVATIDASPLIVQVPSNRRDAANAWWDSYWDDQRIFELSFPKVTTAALRLVISTVSAGGSPTIDAYNAYGTLDQSSQPVTAGMGTATPPIALQRVVAYDSGSSAPVGNPFVVRTIS